MRISSTLATLGHDRLHRHRHERHTAPEHLYIHSDATLNDLSGPAPAVPHRLIAITVTSSIM
jgi:hypothetical protein